MRGFLRYSFDMNLTFNIDLFLNTFDNMRALKGLSTDGACRQAGVSPMTVWRMRHLGYLPYIHNMSKLLLWMSEGEDADLLPYMEEVVQDAA